MSFQNTQSNNVLVFAVGGNRYGLRADQVLEVIRAVAIVPLPRAPVAVEGVINLRGAVVAVFDLRCRFGLPAKPLEPDDHFIIARARERVVALRVDQALELLQLGAGAVAERNCVPGAEYIRWIVRLPEDLLLIHDLDTFLSQQEAAALAEALPPEPPGLSELP